jgi:ubiquinone/menaquinone biosynthesis C-methylase UbiE
MKYIPTLSIDALTPYFDFLSNLFGFGDALKQRVLNLAAIKDGGHILDVGAGTGSLAILAKKQHPHAEVVGVEPDEQALNIAKRKVETSDVQISLIQAGAERLPFSPASFDVVVSTLVFHHLPTEIKKQALTEIYRVLQDNGSFLLADFGEAKGVFLGILAGIVKMTRLPESKTAQDNLDGKIPTFMREAGFSIQEVATKYRGVQFIRATKR